MEQKRVLVTGASGLIGSAFVERLVADGHDVVRLVRRAPRSNDEIQWDPVRGEFNPAEVEGVDAVVHFAGAGIGDQRWTDERRRLLYDSRIDSTALLAETLATLERKPEVLISASAIGYYGLRGDEVLTEESAAGSDYLAQICVDWEAATAPAAEAGIRVVTVRTGLVLDAEQGFLAKMVPLFKLGVGGRLGSGKQWWSWIAKEDVIGAIVFLLGAEVEGPVNLTAPNPVTNADFTNTLGDVLARPALVPVPRFALAVRLGSEMADLTALASQRVEPQQLEAAGYGFTYSELAPALRATLGE